MSEEILYNKLYERTKDFGRTQFVKEIMRLERENQQLKERVVELTNDWNEQIKLTNQENLDCSKYAIENQQLRQKCDETMTKLRQKCDVLDEIREYIDRKRRNFIFSYGVANEFIREYDDLLEILDKVKE